MSALPRIIVIGANPPGLLLVLALLQAGCVPVLLERSATIAQDNSICLIYPSTLELLDAVGLADVLIAGGERIERQQYWNRDAAVMAAELRYDVLGGDTRFPFLLACRRSTLIEVLVGNIRKLAPDALHLGRTPVRIGQGDESVTVLCEEPDSAALTGDYLLATDAVGGFLDLVGMEDDQLHTKRRFMVIECEAEFEPRFTRLTSGAVLLGERSLASVVKMGSCARVVFELFPSPEGDAAVGDTDLFDPDSLMAGLLGEAGKWRVIDARELTVCPRLARSFRADRVLLAGPAAQCFESPLTDVDLNIGLHEAHHLVAAISGAALYRDADAALDAYAVQRRRRAMRMMGSVSGAYYDILANSSSALRFGKWESRLSGLSRSQDSARTFLMLRSLMDGGAQGALAYPEGEGKTGENCA